MKHLVARMAFSSREKFRASLYRGYALGTDFVETYLTYFHTFQKQDFPPVNNKSKSKSAGRVISADSNHGDSKTDTISSSKQSSEKNNESDNVNRTATIT